MNKNRKLTKPQYIVLPLLLLAATAFLAVHMFHHPTNASDNDHPGNSTKNETPADTDSAGNTSKGTGDKSATPSGDYTPPSDNAGIAMTPSTSGDKVVVSTQLTGYSDGACKLTAVNGAKTNSQTANIIYAPGYSTCAGFTVPVNDLGKGTWSLTLDVTAGGITNTKTTTYEVK